MVTIRLTRRGGRNSPFYHVVVTDSRKRQGGTVLEQVGYFNPVARGKDKKLELDLGASRTGRARARRCPIACVRWSRRQGSRRRPEGGRPRDSGDTGRARSHHRALRCTGLGQGSLVHRTPGARSSSFRAGRPTRRAVRARELRLAEGRAHGKGWVVRLEGIDDRDAAIALGKPELWVDRGELPAAESRRALPRGPGRVRGGKPRRRNARLRGRFHRPAGERGDGRGRRARALASGRTRTVAARGRGTEAHHGRLGRGVLTDAHRGRDALPAAGGGGPRGRRAGSCGDERPRRDRTREPAAAMRKIRTGRWMTGHSAAAPAWC